MVPIVRSNGGKVTLQEQRHTLATDDELQAMEKRIRDRGYYPIRLTRDELAAWSADQALVDARFKDEMLRSVEAWMALADERLGGEHPLRRLARKRRHVRDRPDHRSCPARAARRGDTIPLDGFTLVSTGWANPTPWNTFRELPEDELRTRIDGLVATVPDRVEQSSTSTRRRTPRTSTLRHSSTPT